MTDTPLKTRLARDQQILRLTLAKPKANIIDAEMISALSAALANHAADKQLMAVVLDAEGPHFSFGASVEEHLPDQCAEMLKKINALIMQMIVAAPDAMLGQPEISLAVIAPAGSCLLPERIRQPQAEMLLLSGKSIDAERAKQIGLVDEVSDAPAEAALAWIDDNIIGKSASSLRIALNAARRDYIERIRSELNIIERMYLDTLMQTKDPVEGLNAFLEKRDPVWENTTEGAE
jgi:cyclohexa-1,5-dienecarbonyl-CoA hydratase